jgi:hypothetical protein
MLSSHITSDAAVRMQVNDDGSLDIIYNDIRDVPIKSHQIMDFCEHNDELQWFYDGKLYCDKCKPVEDCIKIFTNDNKCAICFEEMPLDIIFDCGHMYCQGCVTEIEKRSSECPICKK